MSRQHNLSTFSSNSIVRRKRVWSRRLRGLASLLLLTMMAGQPSAEAGDFTVQSLRGRWGFTASGSAVPPAVPEVTPIAAMGIMSLNGLGGCSISDTVNIGGSSASRTSRTCSYTVAPNGMGSLEVQFPEDPGPLPISFVVVGDEPEIRFIATHFLVGGGVAKRLW